MRLILWLAALSSGADAAAPENPFFAAAAPQAPVTEMKARPGQSLPLKPSRTFRIDTDEGTWLSPDLSPDGRMIAFDLLGDLYVMPAGGGTARAITKGIAFDSQPVFSPDGRSIAFVSDRSGAENIWVSRPDGSRPRQISWRDDNATFTSPAWSADGKSLYASRFREELGHFELWRFDTAADKGEVVIPIRSRPDERSEDWVSTLGAAPSADGRFLYYASHKGAVGEGVPEWTIRRRDLRTGTDETLVSAPRSPRPDLVLGTAFRPAVSPDGRWLVYGARFGGRTGLHLMELATRNDRWLAFPVQQDDLEASATRDLLPRHVFTADSKALILNDGGKIKRLDIATGTILDLPFRARASVPLGPPTRVAIKQETGPVRARLIQTPEQSPDGKHLAFSALGQIYVMDLDGHSRPRRLTRDAQPEFQPSWSPDGRSIVYVSWTAKDGGHIWRAPADGIQPPAKLSDVSAFYTSPIFGPGGDAVLAIRSSNDVRMHAYMEYGPLRQAVLVTLPAIGGPQSMLAKGMMGGKPHWGPKPDTVFLPTADGISAVALDGSGQSRVVQVTGPGYYFIDGRVPADDMRISPDGKWILAQVAQQLHLIEMPATPPTDPIDVGRPGVRHRKLTDVGADFFEWADGGRTISWAVGSTFYRRPLAGISFDAPGSAANDDVAVFPAIVEIPRDTPRGTLLLRGATAITMHGDDVIPNADILIVDDRIAAIGRRGSFKVPEDAIVRDVTGRYVVPGFIETHDHIADIRRILLDFESWGPLANLAYGVTTSFDPSTLSIDMFAYQDAVDAGLMVGSRIPSTGPALFSFNEFRSREEVRNVLLRYRDHYRTQNLKMYRTGNRRVRQWIVDEGRKLGMMATTEGALALKLDLTQIMDGFSGHEHALPVTPLYEDVVRLVAESGVSYTSTLLIGNGGPPAQDYFITRDRPYGDAKFNRFAPPFIVDMKTGSRAWRETDKYLFPKVAQSVARVARAGGVIGMGSHGEIPGLGFHWEMQAHAMGGMTPAEILRAATLGSARTIGRDGEFGSLEPGKYADLVILTKNPLEDISSTLAIAQVMKNGRLYDGETMDEIWPRQRVLPRRWYCDDRPPGTPDPCTLPPERSAR